MTETENISIVLDAVARNPQVLADQAKQIDRITKALEHANKRQSDAIRIIDATTQATKRMVDVQRSVPFSGRPNSALASDPNKFFTAMEQQLSRQSAIAQQIRATQAAAQSLSRGGGSIVPTIGLSSGQSLDDLVAKIGKVTSTVQAGTPPIITYRDRMAGLRNAAQATGSALENLSRVMFRVHASLALVAAVVAPVALSVNSMADIGRDVQKTGIIAEELSTLQYAAKQSDVSVSQLGTALKGFNKAVAESDKSGTNAAKAFAALGISTRDANGQIKGTFPLLLEVADAFAKYRDDASKATAAQILFEESGVNLIPLLNRGAEGIRQLQSEARGLNLEIGTEQAAAAQEFQKNLKVMIGLAQGAANVFTTALLPALQTFTKAVVENKEAIAGTLGVLAKYNAMTASAALALQVKNKFFPGEADGRPLPLPDRGGRTSTEPKSGLPLNLDAANDPVKRKAVADELNLALLESRAEVLGTEGAIVEAAMERERQTYEKNLAEINGLAEVSADDRHAMLESAESLHQSNIAGIHKGSAERQKAIEEKKQEELSRIRKAQLAGVRGMFENMAGAAEMFGEQGVVAYRVFATAIAVMDTARAAIAAFTSVASIPIVGPFLAPVAAGAAVAFGAVQIAKINGAFAEGGYTGAGGKYEPRGIVHANEYVVPSEKVNEFGLGHFLSLYGGASRPPGYATGGYVRPNYTPPSVLSASRPTESARASNSFTFIEGTRNELREQLAKQTEAIVIDRLGRRGNKFKA